MKRVKRLVLQFAKFSVVGTSCFFVDYFLMIAITEFTPFDYFVACALSFVVSTIVNYILSMRFVFEGKEDMSRVKEIIIFVILSLLALALNQMIMWIVVEQIHVYYMLAKIIATLIVSLYNFVSRKIFLE